ncbi:MAG: PilN domain-containing protein [Vulcanimicrobiaceae bacterium]
MIRFDYIHDPKPLWLQRVAAVRVPIAFRSAALAVYTAFAMVFASWSIEAYRLHLTSAAEARYEQDYQRSRAELAHSKVAYRKLDAMAALDARLYRVLRSGSDVAHQIAEIADRLPAQTSLTSISHDATGFALQGRASDWIALSRTVTALARCRLLRNPELIEARMIATGSDSGTVAYRLHLEEAAR